MGYGHIIYIYDDAIRSSTGAIDQEDKALQQEIGKAVLELCANAKSSEVREHPIESRPIALDNGKYANAVNHIDRPHSGDTKTYVWSGNSLRCQH
jgi:hypothetical protein